MLGVAGEIGMTEAGELGTRDEGQSGVGTWGDVAHEFEEDAAHGIAGIDFDHRLDLDVTLGIAEGEGVDAQRTEVAELEELGAEAGEEVVEEGGELAKGQWGCLAGLSDGGGKAMAMVGGGGIGKEPATGIGDEAGVADEAKGFGGMFQLQGKIGDAIAPGFDDQGEAGVEGVVDPALLGVLELRFPEAKGMTTGGTQGLLDDQSGEAALAQVGDGFEGLVEGSGRETGVMGITHPRKLLPADGR